MTDSPNDQSPNATERREFFRIDDTVRLNYRVLTPEQLAEGIEQLDGDIEDGLTVMSSLAAVTAQMAASMRRIESRDPAVATYLKALDRKIEILGRALLSQESDLLSEEAQPVNLSAGGLSIRSHTPMDPGQALELHMLLFPSFTGLLCFGKVVGCLEADPADNDGYPFQLRVEFVHLREQDREILIRHVLRRQSEELRARRELAERNETPGD